MMECVAYTTNGMTDSKMRLKRETFNVIRLD